MENGSVAQRRHVPGPFDGLRTGLFETPLRVQDLSETECFVGALYESPCGEAMTLKIELQHGEWIELAGETVNCPGEYGFLVRFTEMSDAARGALADFVNTHSQPIRLAS